MKPRPVALSGRRQRLQLGEPPPPQQLGDPGRDQRRAARAARIRPSPSRPPAAAKNAPASEAARGRKQQIASRRQRRVPGLHRFQRGIDHRRAVDRDHRKRRARQPGDHDMAAAPPGRDGRADQRREGGDRQHAFARQPARPPLGQRPPGALRIAEMQRRGQQPAGDQRQRQQVGELGGERRGIEQAEPEQRGKPVAEAGQRREDDDRRRGMHGSGEAHATRTVRPASRSFAPPSVLPDISPSGGRLAARSLRQSCTSKIGESSVTANLPP